jgi:hypothetical protein
MFGAAGNQVRGFGFLHDGSEPTMFEFVSAAVYNFPNNTARRNVEAFMLAFDTGHRPVVGQQVTVTASADAAALARVSLLVARADVGDADLVVHGVVNGEPRGATYVGGDQFQPDRNGDATVSRAAVLGLAGSPGQEATFTSVPLGSGQRAGIDRDRDGVFDRTELDCGTDPADPASTPVPPCVPGTTTTTSLPGTTTTTTSLPPAGIVSIQTRALKMRDGSLKGVAESRKLAFKSRTKTEPGANRIVPPAPGSAGDPTLHGATLTVYNSAGSGESFTTALPAGGWVALGSALTPKGFRFKSSDPGDAVRRVVLKGDLLKVKAKGSAWGYTLDEPSQGRIALRVTAGTGATWCADAPPRVGRDRQDLFASDKDVPAPVVCPPLP